MCRIGAMAGNFGKNGKEWGVFKDFTLGYEKKLRFLRNFGDWGGSDSMCVKFWK
jgi:hypothetical protein